MQIIPVVETLEALLIEDNPDDRELLAKHLRRIKNRKVQVAWCELLSTGIERLAQGGIDIIFLDLALPDSHGIHTLTKVRSLAPTIPIVVMTGSDDDALAMSALEFGAQDYLIKGILDPGTLNRSISYAIERQKNHNTSQWLKSIIDGSNEAIVGKTLDNLIVSWNRGAESIYGYSAEEIIGQSADILIPHGRTNEFTKILEIVKQGNKVEPYEARRRTKEGREIVLQLSVSPVYNSEGFVSGVSVFGRDITEQKHTEELLKLAVSASRVGLWNCQLATGEIQWDKGMYRLFDTNERDFKPSINTFLKRVYQEDRHRLEQTFDGTLLKAGEFNFDFRVQWSDGSIHHLESRGEVFYDDGGKPLHMSGVCADVTDRKTAENALVQTDQRLRLALDSARMGVWDWDLTTDTIWRSPRHDEIFGYTSMLPEWSYAAFLEHVLPGDRHKVQENMKKALERGHFELRCRIKAAEQHSSRWISVQGETHCNKSGKAVRMLGTITDITKAKQLEHQAKQSRQRREQISQAIVEHAPIGIVIMDSEFKVTGVNSKFASMIQCELSTLLDCDFASILPPQVIPTATTFVSSPAPIQVSRLLVVIPSHAPNPKRYWNLSLWPVSDDQGQFTGAAMQVIDITDVILLEQQRDDFVASVAHDIKNPLLGAEQILEMLCEQAKKSDDETHKRMLSILKDSNTNLLSLVQNLVAVYRFEIGACSCIFEEVNLKTIIDGCIMQMSDLAKRQNIELKLVVLKTKTVQADSVGMRRVLMNLLHNAIKFSSSGGKVEVIVDHQYDKAIISITDTGPGISKSDQQRLFQRFSQLSAGRHYTGGSGLGLFLSKQIIDSHHGEISCKSDLGTGATFIITIPETNRSDDN